MIKLGPLASNNGSQVTKDAITRIEINGASLPMPPVKSFDTGNGFSEKSNLLHENQRLHEIPQKGVNNA